MRPYRHRIRIRTTTERSVNPSPKPITYKPPDLPLASELSTRNTDLKNEATTSKLPERLANLYRQNVYDNSTNGRPKNILQRKRRPTTTTTTSTTSTTPVPIITSTVKPAVISTPLIPSTTQTPAVTTETTFKPFIVTSRTSSESKSAPVLIPKNITTSNESSTSVVNTTKDSEEDDGSSSQNQEVVIEAEKTYTASYVLAGLGFLPVAAIIVFVLRNVLNKKTKELDTEYEGYFDDSDIKKESPITPVARPPLPTPTMPDQKWEFPRNKLRLQTLLGQGNFGQVSKILWKRFYILQLQNKPA